MKELLLFLGLAEPIIAAGEGVAHASADAGSLLGALTAARAGRLVAGTAGTGCASGFFLEVGLGFHAEGDAVPGEVHFHDGDLDGLADFDDFAGVFDKVVGELADMDEPILVDADVAEGPEGGDVGDDAGELHADLEVGGFFDAFGESEGFEFLPGVAARFG